MKHYDLIIIGGGPAGLACAIRLKDSGLKVALLEKADYPKQEVCGDGLTSDVYNQLPKLSQDLADAFQQSAECTRIQQLDVKYLNMRERNFMLSQDGKEVFHLFTCPRAHFDSLLFAEAKKSKEVEFYTNCKVLKVEYNPDDVLVQTSKGEFSASMLVAGDGIQSVALRNLQKDGTKIKAQTKPYPAVQAYYKNVKMKRQNGIKIFFYKDILPGYLWIFPLADGRFNVGITLPHPQKHKDQGNLMQVMETLVQTHPNLKPLFSEAERITPIKGRPISASKHKHALSGGRFLLIGDAAYLTNPFTGEGIGNALRSGRLAAETVKEAFLSKNFSAQNLKAYDTRYYQLSKNELWISNLALWVFNRKILTRFFIATANIIYGKYLK